MTRSELNSDPGCPASGFSYDLNGNATSTPQTPWLIYDVDNRAIQMTNSSGTTRNFAYDASNLRVWDQPQTLDDTLGTLTYWSPQGERMGDFVLRVPYYRPPDGSAIVASMSYQRLYHASRPTHETNLGMMQILLTDRLGSTGMGASLYYPYGQEINPTPNYNTTKFATSGSNRQPCVRIGPL